MAIRHGPKKRPPMLLTSVSLTDEALRMLEELQAYERNRSATVRRLIQEEYERRKAASAPEQASAA